MLYQRWYLKQCCIGFPISKRIHLSACMVDSWSLSQLELCTFLAIVVWIKKMVLAFKRFICHPCCNVSITIVYYLHLLLLKSKHFFKFTHFCCSKIQVQQFHLLISSTLGGPLFVLMFWLALVGMDWYLAFLKYIFILVK
jgi:hypothetical protein